MKLEFIYENSFAKAEYHLDKKVLHATFKGTVNADLGQEMFEKVMAFTSQNQIRGAVLNCIEMKGTFTNRNSWFNEVYYPKMISQGFCCWALATKDVFTRYAASLLVNTLTPKAITTKIFGDLESTINWTYRFLEKVES